MATESPQAGKNNQTGTRISSRNKYLDAERDEITKEENENIHLKSLLSDRAGSGFLNWP